MDVQLQSVNIIERWSREAFELSIADPPLGTVLCKSFDFMLKAVKGGLVATSLGYAMGSVQRERDYAMEIDMEKNEPLRRVVYGMSESIEWMIKTLIKKNEEEMRGPGGGNEIVQETPNIGAAAQTDEVAITHDPEDVMVLEFKDEPLDPVAQVVAEAMERAEDKAVDQIDGDQLIPLQQDPLAQQVVGPIDGTAGNASGEFEEALVQPEQPLLMVKEDEQQDRPDETVESPVNNIQENDEPPRSSRKRKQVKYQEDCDNENEEAIAKPAKVHLRDKHGIMSYECKKCSARFGKLEQLREHWQKEGHKTENEKRRWINN